jgi:beta-galactosidase
LQKGEEKNTSVRQSGPNYSGITGNFIRSCVATAAVTSMPVLDSWGFKDDQRQGRRGPAFRALSLDQDWSFGGKLDPAALQPGFDDAAFSKITLPHCVTPLSWEKWEPSAWESIWIYRRHFTVPSELRGLRTFLHFDLVMAGADPVPERSSLPQHLGGFLPFKYEVTHLAKEQNVLPVAVDSRWLNAPPLGSPKGPKSVDYLLLGGISGSVSHHRCFCQAGRCAGFEETTGNRMPY